MIIFVSSDLQALPVSGPYFVHPVNWRSYPECILDENIKLVQGSPLGKGKLSGIRQSKIIQLGAFGRIATQACFTRHSFHVLNLIN
jgi:hypothetical protein